jgi:anti-sigma regulatory factor (Ser/Thr protein kinase)/ActR/RegA family two-component response regulator
MTFEPPAGSFDRWHSGPAGKEPAMNTAASDVQSQTPAGQKTALMVLSDLDASALLIDHLATQGWAIEYVPDNQSALTLVHDGSFDLIITAETSSAKADIELLRKIRRVRGHIRMIILTSESTPADVISALREHAFSYFSTPYSLEALAQVIRIATEGPCWDDGIEVLSATPAWIRLLARCDLGTAERVMQFFHEMVDLPEEEKNEVAYAFREILLNAIRHGAKFDPNQYVEISYVRARHMVECRVKDPGQGFSLNELYHAAVANPQDDPTRHIAFREASGLPPGGYGILLSQNLVDELIYNEKGNEVLLVKYIPVADTAKSA